MDNDDRDDHHDHDHAILRKEEITICPGQDVRQEEKLSQLRMRVNCLKRQMMMMMMMMINNILFCVDEFEKFSWWIWWCWSYFKVMSILLKLVDAEAVNVDGLKDIGNSLLG